MTELVQFPHHGLTLRLTLRRWTTSTGIGAHCTGIRTWFLEITRQLHGNPVPYLLAVAMAANIGSVVTITDNAQNMMIGSFSGIHYRPFTAALSPVALVGLVMTVAVIAAAYHS